jgi:integrase
MPRKLERALTHQKVKSAGPGMHADGGSLYLAVTRAKDGGFNRSWIFRYGITGPGGTKYRDFGMGSLSTLSLSDARERARLLRQKRLDGVDLVEERQIARASAMPVVTFVKVADQWLDAKRLEWKPAHRQSQASRLRDYVHPKIGKLPVGSVTVAHVTDVLTDVWQSHPSTGALIRMQLEQILDFAKVAGHRTGENPARWEGHLKHVFGKTAKLRKAKRAAEGKGEHHKELPYREIGPFMVELRSHSEKYVAALALEFCILTATRSSEALFATWDEVNVPEKTWLIPASRMKAGKEHRVPLSDPALAVIERMAAIRIDNRVFPNLGKDAARNFLQRNLGRKTLTAHGFRSSCRDWLGECTPTPREVCEAVLAHYAGGTEGAYARGDLFEKRRVAMDAWAQYCGTATASAVVVPLRKAAAR